VCGWEKKSTGKQRRALRVGSASGMPPDAGPLDHQQQHGLVDSAIIVSQITNLLVPAGGEG
jgi:hypothetical protein